MKVIAADPPWSFRDKLPGSGRGAAKNYDVMSLDELARFTVPDVGPHAVLFLWRVSSQYEAAAFIAKAWGFKPHSELMWRKLTRTGKVHFGMGRIVRGAHEPCMIAVRGKPGGVADRSIRSVFDAPVGEHSEKPDEFYRIVERLFPHAEEWHELFARRVRPNWIQQGHELGKFPAREAVGA